jgi:hypothetical protein
MLCTPGWRADKIHPAMGINFRTRCRSILVYKLHWSSLCYSPAFTTCRNDICESGSTAPFIHSIKTDFQEVGGGCSIQFNLFSFPYIHYKVKDHMDIEIVKITVNLPVKKIHKIRYSTISYSHIKRIISSI